MRAELEEKRIATRGTFLAVLLSLLNVVLLSTCVLKNELFLKSINYFIKFIRLIKIEIDIWHWQAYVGRQTYAIFLEGNLK